MPRNTRYSPELRERAVTMVVEHRSEYPSEWATMTAVANPSLGGEGQAASALH